MVALRKLDDFTPGTNFLAWMSHIVRLTALNHVRKADRRSTISTDPQILDRAANSPNGAAPRGATTATGRLAQDQSDFDDEIMHALADVGDVARACLLLRAVDQMSYAEIADALQIPQGTAMSHVHRARQTMRERLKSQFGDCLASSEGDTQV